MHKITASMLALARPLTNVSLFVGRGRHSLRRPSRMPLLLSLVLNRFSLYRKKRRFVKIIILIHKSSEIYTLALQLCYIGDQVGFKICSITGSNIRVGEGAREQLADVS